MTSGEYESVSMAGDAQPTVRERCVEEVALGFAAIRKSSSAGEPLPYDPHTVSTVLEWALVYGADSTISGADLEARGLMSPDENLHLLYDLPGLPTKAVVRGSFAAVTGGSQHAYNLLSQLLQAEWDKASEGQAYTRPGDPDAAQAQPIDLLHEVISACEMRDLPATAWIDRYAPSAVWRWVLCMAHYYQLAHHTSLDGLYAPLVNKTAFDLTDQIFGEGLSYRYTAGTLGMVTNTGLKEQLLRHFMYTPADGLLYKEQLDNIMAVGNAVLDDPELSKDPEIVRWFTENINNCVDSIDMAHEKHIWTVRVALHRGMAGNDLLTYINTQADATTLAVRDEMLQVCAVQHAVAGDFTNARLFCDAIADRETLKTALLLSLNEAKTSEQVASISLADDHSAAQDAELERAFVFQEAWLSRNLKVLWQIGRIVAITIRPDATAMKYHHINAAYQAIHEADPAGGYVYASEILKALRTRGEPYMLARNLSAALLRSGDTQELGRAYENIIQTSATPSVRFQSMACLVLSLPAEQRLR